MAHLATRLRDTSPSEAAPSCPSSNTVVKSAVPNRTDPSVSPPSKRLWPFVGNSSNTHTPAGNCKTVATSAVRAPNNTDQSVSYSSGDSSHRVANTINITPAVANDASQWWTTRASTSPSASSSTYKVRSRIALASSPLVLIIESIVKNGGKW
jgi:hypothetical protein